ncbi:hypothetical protein NQ314_008828 [Rhamnusium bicolor]|uniref:PiggyBac transposable element-derived protein domain-containing protein n=1 Tax=Rhamnusium bicolor TaxID=1586634 RepID=A0AAV8Y8D8_9CUCU|nr:hypothetical protein NQ314_008828 [Rhamnusium bicolor]
MWKLRPFLDKLLCNFMNAMDSKEYQSVDEQVIPMKSKISIKQYLPKKPKKWGIKCWLRADTGGYVYRFEIYQGAKSRVAVSPLGACADVVLRLCDDIFHKNHKVFFDNLFCSISLLDVLKSNGIYGTGTLRSNRMQGAKQILPTDNIIKKEPRGTFLCRN